jgi:hypothetical protein
MLLKYLKMITALKKILKRKVLLWVLHFLKCENLSSLRIEAFTRTNRRFKMEQLLEQKLIHRS